MNHLENSHIEMGPDTLYFSNDNVEIHDISGQIPGCIYVYWKGFMNIHGVVTKEGDEASLRIIKERSIRIMISNHDELQGATMDYLHWIDRVYWPKVIDAGMKAEILLPAPAPGVQDRLDEMYRRSFIGSEISEGRFICRNAETEEEAFIIARALESSVEFQTD